jgi:nitroreductase
MRSESGTSTAEFPAHRTTNDRRDDPPRGRSHPNAPTDEASAVLADTQPVDLNDVMVARRSCRRYGPTAVSDTVIASLLDLARHAPSSMDGQPWHFLVVRERAAKVGLVEIKNRYSPSAKRQYPADFLADAPAIVVVCVDLARSFGRHLENGVLAAFSIMLAATRHGLGSVYLSAISAEEPGLTTDIRELFAIPDSVLPISLIPLGYPTGEAEAKALRPLRDMIHYDRFGCPTF